jgi:hypothetical protein
MRHVLAGALTGLAAGAYARSGQDKEGAGGRPDPALAFARGAQAGGQLVPDKTAALQAQSDAATKNSQLAVANNFKTLQNMMASTAAQHAALQKSIDGNQKLFADAREQDSHLNPGDAKAIVAEGLTQEEVTAKMQDPANKGWANYQILPSGFVGVLNKDTGKVEDHPVYTLLNSHAQIPLSKETTDVLALSNPAYADAWDKTGGHVTVTAAQAVTARTEQATIHNTQSALDGLAKEFPGSKPVDLMSLIGKDHTLLKTMDNVEKQMGTYKGLYTQLDALCSAPGGSKILEAMGITQDQADAYINKHVDERTAQENIAKAQGKIAEQEAKPTTPKDAADLEHTNLENKKLQNDLNAQATAGNGLTVPKGFTPSPNASQMDSGALQNDLQTKGVKLPANFESLYAVAHNAADLKTLPPNPRKGSNAMSAQDGLAFIRQYINPQYQEGDYAAASGLSKELASTRQGTAGGSLLSAGVASNHLELLEQAATALNNKDTQLLNRISNTLGIQLGDSPAVTFNAIADQVNAEVGKVVAGGTPHEAELENLRKNLNTNQSPEQTKRVISSYIGLMSGRINEVNERSQQYFGRDVKGISPAVAKVFASHGVDVPGYTRVQVNGQSGAIPNAQVDAFKKKYPNAVTGGR